MSLSLPADYDVKGDDDDDDGNDNNDGNDTSADISVRRQTGYYHTLAEAFFPDAFTGLPFSLRLRKYDFE